MQEPPVHQLNVRPVGLGLMPSGTPQSPCHDLSCALGVSGVTDFSMLRAVEWVDSPLSGSCPYMEDGYLGPCEARGGQGL